MMVERVAALMQLQPPLVSLLCAFVAEATNFSRQDCPALFFSQASSAASSASFPLARLAWHFPMHATAFPTALPIDSSHLRVSLFVVGSEQRPVATNDVPLAGLP